MSLNNNCAPCSSCLHAIISTRLSQTRFSCLSVPPIESDNTVKNHWDSWNLPVRLRSCTSVLYFPTPVLLPFTLHLLLLNTSAVAHVSPLSGATTPSRTTGTAASRSAPTLPPSWLVLRPAPRRLLGRQPNPKTQTCSSSSCSCSRAALGLCPWQGVVAA